MYYIQIAEGVKDAQDTHYFDSKAQALGWLRLAGFACTEAQAKHILQSRPSHGKPDMMLSWGRNAQDNRTTIVLGHATHSIGTTERKARSVKAIGTLTGCPVAPGYTYA